MASKGTKNSTETPGAVAAAFDVLEESSTKTAKAKDTLARHCAQLQEDVTELEAQVADAKAAHVAEVQRMKESRDREVSELKSRLNSAETKLGKVIQTLA